MAGTLHTRQYKAVIRKMVAIRHSRNISQTELAKKLDRNRSFIAKVELCERRLDFIELCIWLIAIGEDPRAFIQDHMSDLPDQIPN